MPARCAGDGTLAAGGDGARAGCRAGIAGRPDAGAEVGPCAARRRCAAGQLAVVQLGGAMAVHQDVARHHPVTVVAPQDSQIAALESDVVLV